MESSGHKGNISHLTPKKKKCSAKNALSHFCECLQGAFSYAEREDCTAGFDGDTLKVRIPGLFSARLTGNWDHPPYQAIFVKIDPLGNLVFVDETNLGNITAEHS